MRLLKARAWLAFTLGIASLLLCLSVRAGIEGGAADKESTQRAAWTSRSLHFVYQGFTTHYSCQGLQYEVRKALLELGARKDLKVEQGACWKPAGEQSEPFPSVNVKMNVLEPASGDRVDANAVVPARWRIVDVRLGQDSMRQAEACELLEQIRHSFLPLFATRNVEYHSDCTAHQVAPAGTWLRAEVLVPDQQNASRALAAR